MSGAQIVAMSREAAVKAARAKREPFVVEAEDLADFKANPRALPFPFLGDYTPPGWEKVQDFFVDSSGWGGRGEAALTVADFLDKLTVGLGYAITETGQFQVYVGEFQRTGPYNTRKQANARKRRTPQLAELAERDKEPAVRLLKQADLLKCRFAILLPEHYRADGTCKCDEPAHRLKMIREWGYKSKDFSGIALRPESMEVPRV